jgi:hypothetical protein
VRLGRGDRFTRDGVLVNEDNTVKRSRLIRAAFAVAAIACSTNGARLDPESAAKSASYATADVELVGTGGLGGFMTRSLVRGSGPSFLYTMHRICSVPNCQAALDSATGGLRRSASDSLFATIDAAAPWNLKDDYGITVGGADMVTYTMRVTIGDRTKTVRADDGTMPEPMRRIAEALRATIAAARR